MIVISGNVEPTRRSSEALSEKSLTLASTVAGVYSRLALVVVTRSSSSMASVAVWSSDWLTIAPVTGSIS